MKIKCKFCGEKIELNVDSEETRRLQTDPHQQMRKHMLKHPLELMSHARRCGWLIDALAFNSVAEPVRWETHLIALLKHFLEETPV